ncbi:cell surface glycoprotein 1 isoform X2 [Cyprinodon tularosa]|uniref:cell surface glycoprotein 1 isoform X2 n=1 Tax=Cyprinodon tularosa TaxID=77115 RepID=UPI0018E1F1FA|nr:cell surface glycoprotein 1 isoform X2 [Cyprinodon tularosa]
MKPDGVATAAMEPMETLDSNPVNEAAGQEPDPAVAAAEETPQHPAGETGEAEPQADLDKKTSAGKTASKSSGDTKAKATNKATPKTKTSTPYASKNPSGTRSTAPQSRLANGTSKPASNGVTKKATPTADKKSTPTSASIKKPAGTAGAPASKAPAKVAEKKTPGSANASNSVKSTTGAPAAKKASHGATNGVKPSTTTTAAAAAAAAKKPPAPKPTSAAPSKTSSAAASKPLPPKTTRPTAGTASSRPATGSSQSAGPAKSSTATSKPATPKPASAKTATPKSSPATPSSGKPPLSQAKNKTPVKKDLTKPATPAAKKPVESPLSRPSSITKSAKPETPKTKLDVSAKKPPTNKSVETKTPSRPKPQESKPTPSKDASKITKTPTNKTSSPKKTVGSTTPTPVKRGPKVATIIERGKEIAGVVAAAAAVATAASVFANPEESQPPAEDNAKTSGLNVKEDHEKIQEPVNDPSAEPLREPTPEPVKVREPTPEPLRDPTPEPVTEHTPEPMKVRQPTPEPLREPTPEPLREPTPEPVKVREPTPEPVKVREPTPEPQREPTPEPQREPTPEPQREPTPEPQREPTPEPLREPTPEPLREPTPEPLREPTPEPLREPTPEPLREQTPEPLREQTPEPVKVREPTPEPVREPTPEPMREPTPEPVREREATPEPVRMWEPSPEPVRTPSPNALREPTPEQRSEAATGVRMSPQMTAFELEDTGSAPSLGTTVMSPPCSPAGPASPVRESQNDSSLLDLDEPSNSWNTNKPAASLAPQNLLNVMTFQAGEDTEKEYDVQRMQGYEEEEEDEEPAFPSTAPGAFSAVGEPQNFGALPLDDYVHRDLLSPHDKEEAVEKADEEINEDDDDDYEYEEERRQGHQLSSLVTDMSTSQPSDDFQARSSAFGGSAGWHGDDLLSGMDSEDMSSCTSSRQQGVSDLSSTLHTALLEGTQSSDALIDSSLRGSEGDGNLMGSPNVETLANEEEEDEDDERVDDMDLSEEQHKVFQEHKQDEEDDEDVEMHSEGVTESGGNVDEDFNEENLNHLTHSGPMSVGPAASSWGQTNPFSDRWAQPASQPPMSSPSPVSDHDAAESETPTQSPAQARVDGGAPSFPQQTAQEPQHHLSAQGDDDDILAHPAGGVPQSDAPHAHSGSETSTPEDPGDYDSSSGVESRSDKQQTPVPAAGQPVMDQDLGIHLEKGDGEEEEAETLPADEVLGTGTPTAPASVPSSPSSSGDEASDTEGEIQINDPEAPMMMMMDDERAAFESPPPTVSLPALEEDEEAGDLPAGEGEEDGGGATPQSANSVASYGFDCTTSNAHSMAESCGKSPGIFSLENEEQLPEEAKDPSLIKELTVPPSAATAQADDLLGSAVDLIPLVCHGEDFPGLDQHHFLLGGKVAVDHREKGNPLEGSEDLVDQECGESDNSQTPYFSTICDKTDSFLEGNV